ncbi:MAG: hypothetical protein V4722_26800 [Bacteroidota bacterium]
MDNQLNLLIALYEEEKDRLQELIRECISESEYLFAYYHSEALYQLSGKLQTLHNIEDKLYDEKEFRKRIINAFERRAETDGSNNMRECYDKVVELTKEELRLLNLIPKVETFPGVETLLDESLAKLLDKKIKDLKLILKKADNFFIGFSYSKKMLKVSLPYVKHHTIKRLLYEDHINSFKKLGFDLSVNETKLSLTLTGSKEDILSKLKIILAKIVFEIFHYKEFENESYIQFTNLDSR